MGLEGVEIVMAVEDEFDVRIDDEAASRMRTIGDLTSHVLRQLGVEDAVTTAAPVQVPCMSARSFYLLRRLIVQVTDADRRAIRPRASLAALLPRIGQRRTVWIGFRDSEAYAPPLRVPRWPIALIVVVATWLALLPLLPGGGFIPQSPLVILVLAAVVIGFCAAGLSALELLAASFPWECRTVGELAEWVYLPPVYPERGQPTTQADAVFQRICRIVAQCVNVPEQSLTPTTDFARDLRL